jgi:hypothetical protein
LTTLIDRGVEDFVITAPFTNSPEGDIWTSTFLPYDNMTIFTIDNIRGKMNQNYTDEHLNVLPCRLGMPT